MNKILPHNGKECLGPGCIYCDEEETEILEDQNKTKGNKMTILNVMECELELARKIFWLIKNDQIFLTSYNDDKNDWDDGAYPAINCNDLFIPGSDAEGLNLEDLDDYINVVKRWPNAGSQAWCAVKRSAKVIPWPWLNSNSEWMIEFDDAVAGIPDMLSH